MNRHQVLLMARRVGRALESSAPVEALLSLELQVLNDGPIQNLLSELQLAEGMGDEERAQKIRDELESKPLYKDFLRARASVDMLSRQVTNVISLAMTGHVPRSSEIPALKAAEELAMAFADSEEMKRYRNLEQKVLDRDDLQECLLQTLRLKAELRAARRGEKTMRLKEIKELQEESDRLESMLLHDDLYNEYREARLEVDRMANAVLQILSYALTGDEFTGGCVLHQHAGPAGVVLCENCGKTSVPLREKFEA